MKKLIVVLIVFLVVLAGCQKAPSENKDKLVVAMELAYPPFETKDEKGEAMGVSVDIAKAFGEYVGKDVEIVNTAWDGLIASLETGKADFVISSMTITDERKEKVDFSIPYANASLALLTNKGSNIKSVEDLNQAGKKVAVKTGTTGFIYAQKNLDKAEIITLNDESAAVTEVAQGKADAFIYDQLTIYRNNQENKDVTEAVFIPFQDVDQWGIAVKKGNEELKNQLDEFIKQYDFNAVSEKYLSNEKKAFEELGFKWFFDLSE